ncbi:fibronectin type III domain-containing protein [Amycolatopsis benzoatilytica]|uniref:fibronectin type III domain-containing protein n=1 Tax=Amycolatopsis benzoatilytica TaxID=346045 RepID=UPI00036E1611|nr:fibronectin type III domain-containing protein [Amycolatopsis benzoatilytica]
MPVSPRRPASLAFAALASATLVFATSCGTSAAPRPPAAPAFTATLTTPTDVVLHWPTDPAAAGYLLEYANAAEGPWTALQYLPPGQTSYTHPNLIPETPFYYRVRSFTGPVSTVTTVGAPHARHPGTAAPVAVGQAGSAPGDLAATAAADQNVQFSWTDHSTDEAGFLLEIRRPGTSDFAPVEVTDPNATQCALSLLPGEQGSAFRLRALAYGPLSAVVERTTGKG